MKFSNLDAKMRIYETAGDYCVPPEMFIVARLDGRSFTRLTKETARFEAPFDERFRDLMAATTRSLMECGFQIAYAYTESDEISLLFAWNEQLFGRKIRKLNSTLAGEASATFSLGLGVAASFDCRICQLPNERLVVDYFRWRAEDAARNALNAWCYWTLRKNDCSRGEATRRLSGRSTSEKNELLFQFGVNYNTLPAWQKRGLGFYWETHEKVGTNPKTGAATTAARRRIRTDAELPMKREYEEFIRARLIADRMQGAL